MIGFAIGIAAATMGTALGAKAIRRRHHTERLRAEGYAQHCTVGLLFFVPDTATGRAIDRTSGSLGFSHVAIDGCEVDSEGRRLLIDCQAGQGVTRNLVSDPSYVNRPHVRVELMGPKAFEFYGCARAKVGLDFDPSLRSGLTCAQLVYECMPRTWQEAVDGWRQYGSPADLMSPNQIAAALGLTGPDSPGRQLW